MEAISQAIPKATDSADTGESFSCRTQLSCILATLAIRELKRTTTSSAKKRGGQRPEIAAEFVHVLAYLPVCAPFLPCTDRAMSLFASDHLSTGGHTEIVEKGCASEIAYALDATGGLPPVTLGDTLHTVLTLVSWEVVGTPSVQNTGGTQPGKNIEMRKMPGGDASSVVSGAVASILLARGDAASECPAGNKAKMSPLLILGAMAISAASTLSDPSIQLCDDALVKVSAGVRALCVAATMVTAAAQGGAGEDETHEDRPGVELICAPDVVAVFPAAILAACCEHRVRMSVKVITTFGFADVGNVWSSTESGKHLSAL